MTEPLYALSIKQPWAALVVAGRKTVEVRTWPTRRRGRILIHTGKVPDLRPAAWAWVADDPLLRAAADLTGGVIGIGELTDCLTYPTRVSFAADTGRHLNDPAWFRPPQVFGFVFGGMRAVPFHPCLGNTNFFRVDGIDL